MNKDGHRLTTKAAVDVLPEWQRKLWEPEAQNLAEIYSSYADNYKHNKEGISQFVEFPDGTVPDFHMPQLRHKHHYDYAIDYWEFPFYDKALNTLNYFGEKIVESIKNEDITSAAKFAGTIAHYIEDNGTPGHAVDNCDLEIIKDLLPPPDGLRRFPFHSRMEDRPDSFSLGSYVPQLCGLSVAEVSSNFVDRLVETTLYARQLILPYFQCFYQNEHQHKTAELNMKACMFCAKVYADFLFTVTSIAREQFEDSERHKLAIKPLAATLPYRQTAWAGGSYSQIAPGELRGVNLDDSFEPIPCELRYQDNNKNEVVIESDALGATAYFEYEFRIPPGVYHQLTFDYGIHTSLGAKYPITFEVYCDDDLLFKEEKQCQQPSGSVTLPWPEKSEKLQLITSLNDRYEVQRTNGRPGGEATGHAVWSRPSMVKFNI